MKTRTVFALRALVVAALVAAVLDLPLPARSRARVRVHLVDRSGSVLVRGPAESLRPADADRIVAWDRAQAAPGDVVLSASFGREVAFESDRVDPSATALETALEAALARAPTEIVLYTDGQADPGRALLLARARGVPVHVFPLGPVEVRDARIARLLAPPAAPPGRPVPVEVVVESTFAATLRVRFNDEVADVPVLPGAPVRVPFEMAGPGPFHARLEGEDDCPENDAVRGAVLAEPEEPPVLWLSETPRRVAGFDVAVRPRFEAPQPFDVVVVDNVALAPAQQRALADYVETFGGALLLVGGPRAFASGGWAGTPIEALSPLWSRPFGDVAVAFVVDASGSMEIDNRLHTVLRAVEASLAALRPGDRWAVVAFSDSARVYTEREALRNIRARGPTLIVRGLEEARRWLENTPADRRHIVLLTDGETSEEPDALREAAERLGDIGLTAVTTLQPLPIGRNLPIEDWRALAARMDAILSESQDLVREDPGPLEPRAHPAMRDVPPFRLPRIHRTSAKEDAQVAATAGDDPAVAFRQAGRGRTGAFAFAADAAPERLLRRALEFLAGDAPPGTVLAVDPPTVRARGAGPPRLEVSWQVAPDGPAGTLILEQTGSDAWEGTLPPLPAGTVVIRHGRARAAATVACPPEYERLGVDREALRRIAHATGGTLLESEVELAALPRPTLRERRGGRPFFLVAALVLLFAEMAVSTFWKR